MIAQPRVVAAPLLLAVILWLVLTRPRGLPEGASAALGAALAVLTGLATLGDLVSGLTGTVGILVFLVSVMLLTGLAGAAGVFRWAAGLALLTARGRGWLLFVNVYLLGALITLLLSLDVTAVVLTPLVCALVLPLRLDARPFVLASVFIANTASLALPVSNLTNMLVYDLLGVGFWDFVRFLALPNLLALVLNLALLLALFWRRLPGRLRVSTASFHLPPEPFFRSSLALLSLTVLSLLISGLAGWPFWPSALAGALLLAALSLTRGWITARHAAATVAWGLPPFVVGMYVVVAAVYRALEPTLIRLPTAAASLPGPLTLASAVAATTLGANAVNNLPLSLAAIQLLRSVPPDLAASTHYSLRDTLAFGTLIGVNLGPNLTITGSLATMLCLASARRVGVHLSAWEFTRTGLVVSVLPMVAATAALSFLLAR